MSLRLFLRAPSFIEEMMAGHRGCLSPYGLRLLVIWGERPSSRSRVWVPGRFLLD